MLEITPTGQACGATVTGVDLAQELDAQTIADIRDAWLVHHVLVFPDQELSDDGLERFSQYFGKFGHDPFFGPIEGRKHIAAIKRLANETTSLFAEVWHTDWSFQKHPPIATFLYGLTIPPHGGDTLFANQHLAYDKMPDGLHQKLEGKTAIHSAALGYSKQGAYNDEDKAKGRSMDIRPSDEALKRQTHPIFKQHNETGRMGIFGSIGAYVIGFEGMDDDDASNLLQELNSFQTRDEFIYTHKWQKNMLIMWDNRSVLHRASGGYEGYDRLLHRITIAQH